MWRFSNSSRKLPRQRDGRRQLLPQARRQPKGPLLLLHDSQARETPLGLFHPISQGNQIQQIVVIHDLKKRAPRIDAVAGKGRKVKRPRQLLPDELPLEREQLRGEFLDWGGLPTKS